MRAAGEATRRRILTEAKREFAEYGLAGARINRIATQARASKERLYAYYAGKEELFAAVCADIVQTSADEARFSADDVPGYVGRLFDIYVGDPDIGRLVVRLGLDGARDLPDAGASGDRVYGDKVAELRRAQEAGTIDAAWEPAVLLGMLIGIARLMSQEHQLLGFSRSDDRRPTLDERRASAVRAAEKLVRPDA